MITFTRVLYMYMYEYMCMYVLMCTSILNQDIKMQMGAEKCIPFLFIFFIMS